MLNVSRHTRNLFESVLVLKKLTEARSMEQRPNRESHCKHRDKNKSIHISSIYICVCVLFYIYIYLYILQYVLISEYTCIDNRRSSLDRLLF